MRQKYKLDFPMFTNYWRAIAVTFFIILMVFGYFIKGHCHVVDIHLPTAEELGLEWQVEQQKKAEEEAKMIEEYYEALQEEQNQQSWDNYYQNKENNVEKP